MRITQEQVENNTRTTPPPPLLSCSPSSSLLILLILLPPPPTNTRLTSNVFVFERRNSRISSCNYPAKFGNTQSKRSAPWPPNHALGEVQLQPVILSPATVDPHNSDFATAAGTILKTSAFIIISFAFFAPTTWHQLKSCALAGHRAVVPSERERRS